jgi:hypothetical protein
MSNNEKGVITSKKIISTLSFIYRLEGLLPTWDLESFEMGIILEFDQPYSANHRIWEIHKSRKK